MLSAGPALTNRLTSAPPQVWSLAEAADGTLWAGTGGDGRLLRLRPGAGSGKRRPSTPTRRRSSRSPRRHPRVCRIEPGRPGLRDRGRRPARPFFDPDEKYIWALAVDAGGRLWVGAGNPAVIYRVDANGAGTVVYRPPAAHVVTLRPRRPRPDARRHGIARAALSLRSQRSSVRPARLRHDRTACDQRRRRRRDLRRRRVARRRGRGPAGEVATIAAIVASATPPAPGATPASPPARRSVLYRIEPSAPGKPIWETADVIYDLAAQDDGVLVATGPEGRLYRVDREPSGAAAHRRRREADHALRARGPTARPSAFATANPGRVVALGTAPTGRRPATSRPCATRRAWRRGA